MKPPAPAAISPHRLTQVVLNLFHNARDAILVKAGGDLRGPIIGSITIQAAAQPDKGELTLKIMDDGCGMNEEVKRRSIEPFFTTRDRPNQVGGVGSGIGLSLALATIERIGGQLEIASQPGKGTTITLNLPVADQADITVESNINDSVIPHKG